MKGAAVAKRRTYVDWLKPGERGWRSTYGDMEVSRYKYVQGEKFTRKWSAADGL
jgi:hypothetical protein